jgi:hypothetical protein
MQRFRFQKGEYRSVYLRPFRLHHVEHEGCRIVTVSVNDAQRRIVAFCDGAGFALGFAALANLIRPCIG